MRNGVALALALGLALGAFAVAAQEPARPPAQPGPASGAPPEAAKPAETVETARPAGSGVASYQLPTVGKPRRRIGGGRRGPGDPLPELWALVPEHVALTASEKPTLFWYLSDASPGYVIFELTLVHESSIEPVVDVRLSQPQAKGLQRVDLGAHGVALAPGQEYQWSLALVVDPEQRSRDVVATGWIERVPAPDGLDSRLSAAGPGGAAAVYADAGLWYDALAAIWRLSELRPGDPEPQQQLDALLTQVGLPSLPLAR